MAGTFEHPSGDEDVCIVKTDSLGNLIFLKIFSEPNTVDGAGGITINSKGHVIVGGGGGRYNQSNLSTLKNHTIIYELDTGGNPFNVIFGSDTNGPSANNFIKTDDGGFLTASVYTCARSVNFFYGQGCIAKFDSSYNEVWRIDVGPCSIATGFFSQQSSGDGNYIAVGSWCAPDDRNMMHVTGFIVKYSGDGHLIWSREYRGISNYGADGDFNQIYSSGLFSDQSTICAGAAVDNDANINGQQGWLLHLDTAGCLPDSNSCGIVDAVADIQRATAQSKYIPIPHLTC